MTKVRAILDGCSQFPMPVAPSLKMSVYGNGAGGLDLKDTSSPSMPRANKKRRGRGPLVAGVLDQIYSTASLSSSFSSHLNGTSEQEGEAVGGGLPLELFVELMNCLSLSVAQGALRVLNTSSASSS